MCIFTKLIWITRCHVHKKEDTLKLWPGSSCFIPIISTKQGICATVLLLPPREWGLGLLFLGFPLWVWFGFFLFGSWVDFGFKQLNSKFCKQIFVQISQCSSGLHMSEGLKRIKLQTQSPCWTRFSSETVANTTTANNLLCHSAFQKL